MYMNCEDQGNGGAAFAYAIRDGAERDGLSAGRTLTGALSDAILTDTTCRGTAASCIQAQQCMYAGIDTQHTRHMNTSHAHARALISLSCTDTWLVPHTYTHVRCAFQHLSIRGDARM